MALFLHILIACISLGFTAYVFFRPSAARLQASLGLAAGTIGSGTLLIVTSGVHMLETCISGLLYLGVIITATIAASRKLAAEKVRSRK